MKDLFIILAFICFLLFLGATLGYVTSKEESKHRCSMHVMDHDGEKWVYEIPCEERK